MLLNLNNTEAAALERELVDSGPELDGVRRKLTGLLGPHTPDVIPGQVTIDELLEDAA